MKVLRNFKHFFSSITHLQSAINTIDSNLTSNWAKDQNWSNESSKGALQDGIYHIYVYKGNDLPKAGLCFMQREMSLEVVNIVPTEKSELSVDEYNVLLTDFISTAFSKLMKFISPDAANLRTYLSQTSEKLLANFSYLANRRTVHHHPCDKENWYRFILSVYRRREYKKLHEDNLRILLQETYGWSEEAADELASSYRESLNLIRFIKKGRIA